MKKITLIIFLAFICNNAFSQIITTIAGTGIPGYSGDGGPATAARLHTPGHIAVDIYNNIYFTDDGNNIIRRIDLSGNVTTFAGTGLAGYSGDGGPATAARFNAPNGMVIDNLGNLFCADEYNHVIRKVNIASGIVTTVAGNGFSGYSGDGMQATASKLYRPTGCVVDDSGNIFIADAHNHRLRKVNSAGLISTVAGNGTPGFSGDGGPASAALLYFPGNVTLDPSGNIYIDDQYNQRVRKITAAGIMSSIAGNGAMGYGGDGGPATAATLYYPSMEAVRNAGVVYSDVTLYNNLYIDDSYNNRIRMVDSSGTITTIAGNGSPGYSGDGGPATAAKLNQPYGFAFDNCGNLLIADAFNNVIRKVTYFTSMPSITGPILVGVGSSIPLYIAAAGGVWSSSNTSIATVGSVTGIVVGVSPGTDTITYTNSCGTSMFIITVYTPSFVNTPNRSPALSIVPNPNNGIFTLNGILPGLVTQKEVTIEVMNILGEIIYNDATLSDNGMINKPIILKEHVANGIYILKLTTDNINYVVRFNVYR